MAEQLLGTDYTQILQSKKQSKLFTDLPNTEKLGPGTFLVQIVGWLITRFLSLISGFLSFILQIEKALINLRVDTLQLFYWGRGNVFALFAQSILFFIVVSVLFTWIVGQGLTPRVVEQYVPVEQQVVFASNQVDIAIEAGSLTTLLPKDVKRIDMEEYVVTYGDTIGGDTIQNIAVAWDVSADSIRWANNFQVGFQPKAGSVVKIPPATGSQYTVLPGENLEIVSAKFKVDQATIAETNFLAPPFAIAEGQVLFIPGVAPFKPTPVPVKKSTVIYSKNKSGTFTPPTATKFLSWPVAGYAGQFSRCFSAYHDGIDIASGGKSNPDIVASAPGRVTYAGVHCTPGMWGSPCGGYAWVVEIDHGNGYSTLYGHLLANSLKVGVGDVVTRGQIIAKMGNTGTSTGTHLHFQLNHGGFLKKGRLQEVNPGPYMLEPKFCG